MQFYLLHSGDGGCSWLIYLKEYDSLNEFKYTIERWKHTYSPNLNYHIHTRCVRNLNIVLHNYRCILTEDQCKIISARNIVPNIDKIRVKVHHIDCEKYLAKIEAIPPI